MYSYLLFFHSTVRWLVLLSLLYAIYRGLAGWSGKILFTSLDNKVRHITATIAHVQLIIGYGLYFSSPLVSLFRANYGEASKQFNLLFFGLIHVLLMTIAIVLITIGSSVAKRKDTDQGKFQTMAIWYILALIVIFVAIPWPFSPLANRPYFRSF